MILATTTGDIFAYHTPEEKIRALRRAGFKHIDLSLYQLKGDDSWILEDGWQKRAAALQELAASLGMDFVQSHAPGGNPLGEASHVEELLAATVRTVEVCGFLGIPTTVVHPGCLPDISYEEFLNRNLDFYRRLYPAAERCGVRILTENSTRANLGTMEFFYTGAQMREFLEMDAHPLLGACWDTGHANCEGHQYRDLTDLGALLQAVHINDNRGSADEHLIPFCGTCPFDEVIRGLLDIGFCGPFTLESSSTLRPGHYWLGDRRGDGNGRLFDPPAALQDAAEALLYQAGKCLLDAYGLFED